MSNRIGFKRICVREGTEYTKPVYVYVAVISDAEFTAEQLNLAVEFNVNETARVLNKASELPTADMLNPKAYGVFKFAEDADAFTVGELRNYLNYLAAVDPNQLDKLVCIRHDSEEDNKEYQTSCSFVDDMTDGYMFFCVGVDENPVD